MPVSFDLEQIRTQYNCKHYFETGLWDPTTNVSSKKALRAGFDTVHCIEIKDEWIDNYNPSNGEVYSQIPNSSHSDVEEAYQAAENAYPEWSNTTLEYRSKILSKIATLIEENLEDLAKAEAIDNGKPLSLAKTVDIPRASSNFQFFANAITQFSSEAHESVGLNAFNFTLRTPLVMFTSTVSKKSVS